MTKYVLSFFLLLTVAGVMGQKKSIVNLIRSRSSTGIKLNGKDLLKVYQGTFKQDYSTLTSDSAYFYPQDNAFDAFGHVDINQGDTLNIYSDKLNYNGNTKIAILTDNVRMVDKDATLTTNHLVYNTATRIGTYTDGGKLVNKDNTLLSKNGYYFAFSRDSYFRYNVSLTTPDALIKTDTMRYNTGTKIAYFYGPTNIYGTKGEKDKDTLYTENGNYNTGTEQAAFGKKNLYKSGTKSLKGDSLFYDKLKGYGRAVKHVTFTDREQKTTIKGNLGTYFKAEERTVMTQDPYVIIVTEQKDTTAKDSALKADTVIKKATAKNKNAINMADLIKNTIPIKMGQAEVNPGEIRAKADSITKTNPAAVKKIVEMASQVTLPGDLPGGKALKKAGEKLKVKIAALKDTGKIKQDSVYFSGDTVETQILTYKNLKIYQEKQRLSHVRDTASRPKTKVKEKESKFLTATYGGVPRDTSYRHSDYFGKPKPVVVKPKQPKIISKKQLALDSVKNQKEADSLLAAKKLEPLDTARIRIMIAHHHAKLFKSDLQAKADSMFFSYADSTVRCYVNPIIWSQGSQLSGDTVYLQMKHKKLDNMTMFPNAFIVNIEKGDSSHFNQIAGKLMRGFFKDDKLSRMYINGNAESIYFSRDSVKQTVTGMERSLSSRMRVDFKDNKATNLSFYTKPENKYGPLEKFKEDDKVLKGFIWKPKERPASKEAIIPSYYNKKKSEVKTLPGKLKPGKPSFKKLPGVKALTDTATKILPGKLPVLKTGKDSVMKSDTAKSLQPGKGKDSVIVKPVPLNNAAGKKAGN